VDVDVIMPEMGESIAEATIVRWMKHEGDAVEQDESIAEIESDKAVVELPSPAKGVVKKMLVLEDQTVPVGTVIAQVSTDVAGWVPPTAEAPPAAAPHTEAPAQSTPASAPAPTAGMPILSPLVSKLVALHGVDPAQIQGTGNRGRITKKDVMAHVATSRAGVQAPPAEPPAPSPAAPPAPRPTQAPSSEDRVVPLEGIRAAIADHLTASVSTIPHVTTVAEVDMTPCVDLRAQWKPGYAQRGLKLTYLPLVCNAICRAVPEFPGVNASLVDRQITYYGAVHLGISVAREQGLVVVVLRDAHQMSVADLAGAIQDMAQRARGGKLKGAETRGGTLTITNPGSLGALVSTPIINAPQSAIVSIQAMQKRPVVVGDDAIAIRTMMNIGMSYDHRIIDGEQAIGFLQSVRRTLEAADFLMEA
jgi:pyruvate/2-oxoglutarate dehydrogenase complex dihydrolipoamide acyltransferase (E2) component